MSSEDVLKISMLSKISPALLPHIWFWSPVSVHVTLSTNIQQTILSSLWETWKFASIQLSFLRPPVLECSWTESVRMRRGAARDPRKHLKQKGKANQALYCASVEGSKVIFSHQSSPGTGRTRLWSTPPSGWRGTCNSCRQHKWLQGRRERKRCWNTSLLLLWNPINTDQWGIAKPRAPIHQQES